MPTKEEYSDVFSIIVDDILSRDFKTKSEARHLAALANKAVRAKRDEFTRGISSRWKGEFARIKVENDQWQKALDVSYHDWLVMIDDRLGDMLED